MEYTFTVKAVENVLIVLDLLVTICTNITFSVASFDHRRLAVHESCIRNLRRIWFNFLQEIFSACFECLESLGALLLLLKLVNFLQHQFLFGLSFDFFHHLFIFLLKFFKSRIISNLYLLLFRLLRYLDWVLSSLISNIQFKLSVLDITIMKLKFFPDHDFVAVTAPDLHEITYKL